MSSKERKVSTLEQRRKALEYVHAKCQSKDIMFDSYIYQSFGVTRLLERLLLLGVVKPGEGKNTYMWDPTITIEDVLHTAWQLTGRKIATKVGETQFARTDSPNSIAHRVELALDWVRQYGIKEESAFIMDAVNGTGLFEYFYIPETLASNENTP